MSSIKQERNRVLASVLFAGRFVVLIWVAHFLNLFIGLSDWGIYPRTIDGLWGLLFYPLLHGDFEHLISNSAPMFVLLFLIRHSYPRVAHATFWIIYILSGVGVWLFARPSFHIGASGLVYGLAFFLFAIGIMRKNIPSMAVALLVCFLYGGIIWGLLPLQPHVSFEGHIAGAVSGIVAATLFRSVDLPPGPPPEEPEGPIVEEPFWRSLPPEDDFDLDIEYRLRND